jgi:hypothetical protein
MKNQISKKLIFVFLIKDASKNKIKKNNKKVNDWKRETPLAEILFLPGNGARKIARWCVDVRPIGNPMRKV